MRRDRQALDYQRGDHIGRSPWSAAARKHAKQANLEHKHQARAAAEASASGQGGCFPSGQGGCSGGPPDLDLEAPRVGPAPKVPQQFKKPVGDQCVHCGQNPAASRCLTFRACGACCRYVRYTKNRRFCEYHRGAL